jgi:hypothetical protein
VQDVLAFHHRALSARIPIYHYMIKKRFIYRFRGCKMAKTKLLTRVGFEPTHITVVEIQAGLKSTALDHSAIVSLENWI